MKTAFASSVATTPDTSLEVDEEDEKELQAALAACHSEETSASHATVEADNKNLEVLYQKGATDLFSAIEDTRWAEALELCDAAPTQASTWVKSTGTENTTFGWSLWRRLPIHEACRRQPPAWMVAALLRANPKGAEEKTQFGQLPLHLAVETGASPEVVNLLIVAHWRGILARDNSGRTPLDVFQSGTLGEEDCQVVEESLQKCLESYLEYEGEWQQQLKGQQDEFLAQLQKRKDKHILELRNEREKQAELEASLDQANDDVLYAQKERDDWKRKIAIMDKEKTSLQKEIQRRHGLWLDTRSELEEREADLDRMQKLLQEKDFQRNRLENRIRQLELDLQSAYLLQQSQVNTALAHAQKDLARVWKSQQVLQGKLSGQTQGLEMLLKQRGIDVPDPNGKEEKKSDEASNMAAENTTEEVLAKAALATKIDNGDEGKGGALLSEEQQPLVD